RAGRHPGLADPRRPHPRGRLLPGGPVRHAGRPAAAPHPLALAGLRAGGHRHRPDAVQRRRPRPGRGDRGRLAVQPGPPARARDGAGRGRRARGRRRGRRTGPSGGRAGRAAAAVPRRGTPAGPAGRGTGGGRHVRAVLRDAALPTCLGPVRADRRTGDRRPSGVPERVVTAVLAPVRRADRVRGLLVGNVAARLGALAALAVATVLVARVGGPSLVGAFTLLRVLPGLAGVLAAAG